MLPARTAPHLGAALLIVAACGQPEQAPPHAAPAAGTTRVAPAVAPEPLQRPFLFTDVAKSSGVTAISWCGRPEKPHLLESGGNGIALFDYDSDGDLDLYVVSGWRLAGAEVAERTKNVLYRNRGDGTFDDVTAAAGVGDDGWGTGVATGDVDGDGHPDLFVTNFGPDVLYRNRGDGTFERVANSPGMDGWSAGAVFFDADGDGDDDLFVCGYIECTLDGVLHAEPTLDWKGQKVMPGPFGLAGKANRYFRNDAGAFVEATASSGLTDVGEFFSFAVAACDLDGDLDLDLYVANDSNPNYLYRNDGKGHFEEIGLWCGAGLSGPGAAQAGMGIAIGDYDGDLLSDILVTNFDEDVSTLYRNTGRLLFRDVTNAAGVREPTYPLLSWGAAFADLDLDGDEDLFVANGHIYPQADRPGTRTTFRQRNLLLENQLDTGTARFRDATSEAGPGLAVVEASHGVAAGDIDGDGDIDFAVSNVDAAPTILRNDSPRAAGGGTSRPDRRHWLMLDAPDALRVVVEAGGRKMVRDRVRGGSFCSVSDPRFHFGLGTESTAARVLVRWPDGRETDLHDVPSDAVLRVERPR